MAMLPDCSAGAGMSCKHNTTSKVALFAYNERSLIHHKCMGLRVTFFAKAPASRATLSSRPQRGILAEKQQDLISPGLFINMWLIFLHPRARGRTQTRKGGMFKDGTDVHNAMRKSVVTEKTWKELVLDSDIPVLVDFWAPWCGPCRMIGPLVDDLAKQYNGRIRCLKVNTDDCPNMATEFGIRSIPTVLIFKRGEKKETIIGAIPKAALTSTVEKFLGS